MSDTEPWARFLEWRRTTLETMQTPWMAFVAGRASLRAELAARDRENRAIGWDEGHTHCFHVENPKNESNPYRGAMKETAT